MSKEAGFIFEFLEKIIHQKRNVDPATEIQFLIWLKNGALIKQANSKTLKKLLIRALKGKIGDVNEILLKINDYAKKISDKSSNSNTRIQRFVISFSDLTKELRNGAVSHLR